MASDPISKAGLNAQLRAHGQLALVEEIELAAVGVVVADDVGDDAVRSLRELLREGLDQVALVVTRLDDEGVLRAVEAGACTIIRRSEATPEHLASVLLAAVQGHGSLPPDLLGSLLSRIGELHRHGAPRHELVVNGFAEREVEVLRLLAEGLDTAEVAAKLSYSERTVKNVVHDVVTRLHLRNRCHAIAHAIRAGVI